MSTDDFRTELKAQADELGIEYPNNAKTDKLLAAVNEARAELGQAPIEAPEEPTAKEPKLSTEDELAKALAKSDTLTSSPKTKKPEQTPELKKAMLDRVKLINVRMTTDTVSADVRKNMRYELKLIKQGMWEPGKQYRDPSTSSALDQVFSD